MIFAILAALTALPPSSSAWTAQKPAVQAVVAGAYPAAHINSILIKQSYALVSGKGVHAALQESGGKWKIICDVSRTMMNVETLHERCGIPSDVATRLADDEPVNLLVSAGNFSAAIDAEQTAAGSISAPASDTERARLQELRMLNQEMQLQQITREQAIQQWSQLQYSWALP